MKQQLHDAREKLAAARAEGNRALVSMRKAHETQLGEAQVGHSVHCCAAVLMCGGDMCSHGCVCVVPPQLEIDGLRSILADQEQELVALREEVREPRCRGYLAVPTRHTH